MSYFTYLFLSGPDCLSSVFIYVGGRPDHMFFLLFVFELLNSFSSPDLSQSQSVTPDSMFFVLYVFGTHPSRITEERVVCHSAACVILPWPMMAVHSATQFTFIGCYL